MNGRGVVSTYERCMKRIDERLSWLNEGRRCRRKAVRIVRGNQFCEQHARVAERKPAP